MDNEQILKLIDAGYTKADIDAMQANNNAGGTVDENAGNENSSAGNEQGNAGAENASAVDVNEMLKTLTETVNGLTATVKAMQDKAIAGASTETPKTSDKIKETMDSFINSL